MGFFYVRRRSQHPRPSLRFIRKDDLKPDDPAPADQNVRRLISEIMRTRRMRQLIEDGEIVADNDMIETIANRERMAFHHLAAYLSAIAWVKKPG